VDTRSEWRNFTNDDQGGDDPSRVGEAANPLLHGSQLHSEISFEPKGGGQSKDLMRAQNKVNEDKNNKALTDAFTQIQQFCDSIELPITIATNTKALYRITYDSREFKGKGQDAVIAGCLFIACRQHNVPRTFKEIVNLTKVPKKDIGRIFKLLEKFFKNSKHTADGPKINYQVTQTTEPKELCGRICNLLGVSKAIAIMSSECAAILIENNKLSGRSPLSVASLAVYIVTNAMGMTTSAKQVGEAAGISDGTVKAAWKACSMDQKLFFDDAWLLRGAKKELLPPS